MREQLLEVVSAVGKPAEIISSPDGTVVVVLPYGGRILGLYAPDSNENFLWTHPALAATDSAKAFLASDQWHNSGGDRTWLAPEADFFLPKFPDTSVYYPPRQLDPGNYRCERRSDAIRLRNRFTLQSSRTKQDVDLRITKSVGPAENPLRWERQLAGLDGLKFAGYTLRCSLEILGRGARGGVGLWNLLQLPHGGEMLIPTYSRVEPKVYFGQIPAEDLIIEDRLIRYTLRAKGEQKIGVRALAAPGRVGYLHRTGQKWALVVRNFAVNPSGTYIDVPWDGPADLGYAVQACNVSSRLGSFSELEYHVPAIGGHTALARSEDVSQVWAFRGEAEPIRALARLLLTG